jgi:predicted RNA binding protein YcfA (HicA-like mRNA interferase family)
MNSKKEEIKKCKTYKDFEKFIENEGFEYDRTSGGHKQFTRANSRTIPIPSHGKEPQGNLKARFVKEILVAIGGLCFFLMIWHNLSIMV